jgi:16S rRNA (cytosine967-C5)-methyltransferase
MTAASIAPARRAAFDILRKVGRGRGNSDTLLHSLQVNQLSAQDRNLCTTLVLGTLRWQLVLDSECRRFLARPDLTLPEDALLALRVGAYQLLFLDRIPTHAALFESVEWCKHSEGARQSGLVNAVLRKVAALPKNRTFDAEQAYPQWMVARWKKFYGAETCRKICEQGQTEAETALRLLADDAEEMLRSQGMVLQPGAFLAKGRRIGAGEAKGIIESLEATASAQLQDASRRISGARFAHSRCVRGAGRKDRSVVAEQSGGGFAGL